MPKVKGDRAPVMADVARVAGVSHQTVSRVLNDHPNVRPTTRDRVLAAIRALDYRPNTAARSLVTRRSGTLGVVSFNTTLYGPASMMYGIEQAARQHDYFVMVAVMPSLDRRSVLDAVNRLLDQGVEGIIVVAPEAPTVSALASILSDVPLVAVGCGTSAPLNSVAIDNMAGAEQAVSYLLDLGHPTVHHLAGPSSWFDAREREAGWRATLVSRGAPVPQTLAGGDWSSRTGFELGHRIARDPDVTAVFCANDHMALGLLRALREGDRDVPGEVSVVGFDDIPESEYLGPPLTTVRQEFGELGRRALRLLIDLIDGTATTLPHVAVASTLVVRASAARPTAH